MESPQRKAIDLTKGYIPVLVVVSIVISASAFSSWITSIYNGQNDVIGRMAVINSDIGEIKKAQTEMAINQALMNQRMDDMSESFVTMMQTGYLNNSPLVLKER